MEIACTGVILSVFYNVTRSLQIRYSKRHVANRNFYRWLWHTTFSIECHLNREKFVEFKETLKKKIDAILIKTPNTKKNIFFKISFCFNCFHTKIYFSLGFSQVQKAELIKKHIYIYISLQLHKFPHFYIHKHHPWANLKTVETPPIVHPF